MERHRHLFGQYLVTLKSRPIVTPILRGYGPNAISERRNIVNVIFRSTHFSGTTIPHVYKCLVEYGYLAFLAGNRFRRTQRVSRIAVFSVSFGEREFNFE